MDHVQSTWLAQIAAHYITNHRDRARTELAYFRELPTDEDAISRAALGKDASGRRHAHQRRLHQTALKESERRLGGSLQALKAAESFHELINLVDSSIRSISGIGELAVYDIALRIGARFGIEPSQVYLHRGTRQGARALGLGTRRAVLDIADLPAELQKLSPREAEDALCIYKHQLAQIVGGRAPDPGQIHGCTPSKQASRQGSTC